MGSDSRTLWVGNLSDNVDEDLLYELFIQAGPLENVNVKKCPPNGGQNPFAFVTFRHEISVGYAIALFEGISLYGRSLNMKQRHGVTPDYKYRDMMESYLRELHHSRGRLQWDNQSQGYASSVVDLRSQQQQQQQQQQQLPLINYGTQLDQYGMRYMAQQQLMVTQQQQHYDIGSNAGGGNEGARGRQGGFRREQRDVGQQRDSRSSHGHAHERHEKSGASRRYHGSKHHYHSR
ncbi:hypothetical protein BIW11_02073 [Tropilaelaps mercedesae]|uniref:RRM domain-containing protein n=1 Tax=Tropilaelaps mercedesae TaxID=418985 RepID=A0A1V9X433_9ACAR|nr:hypothetical protein BIW11_02073 [Tropilaelaps mercedesae]